MLFFFFFFCVCVCVKRMSKLKSKPTTNELPMKYSSTEEEEEEEGSIQCICDDMSDDGFTIQCEDCEKWQHAECVKIKKTKIPDHYICYRCMKKKSKLQKPVGTRFDGDHDILLLNQFTYTNKSVFKERIVMDLFKEIHRQWMDLYKSNTSKASPITSNTHKGLDSITVMESDLLLPVIPKATIKPIQKALRGSFLQRQKTHTQKGLFADIHIPKNRYLMEVTGELMRKSAYKNNPANKYQLLGTPLAHVFFIVRNDSRYIRRSCSPNAELKSIILPHNSHDQMIHMGIYTNEQVGRGEEITLGWDWNTKVMMYQKNKDFFRHESYQVEIKPEERGSLKEMMDLITKEFGDCACENKDECLIEYLKDELKKEKAKKAIFSSDEDNQKAPVHSNAFSPPKKRWLLQYTSHKKLLAEQDMTDKNKTSNDSAMVMVVKPMLKKISLQEYMSRQRQSQSMHD
ncbi:uncharacterized protein B0P05DRAFT_564969 [Gilbertella persicaria]|uniref:uncharacterized protein n=1 Tax=Gilbertella persicaria TaxID=101096 RepID=UPI00221F5BAA|nr:uncharacterized protein B0P05DRAFT_564969 [Gilbertella persicaria]KAI8047945.1 hypothetical protein B0P05DRAFT_564969 [Gilbertella persicaria]